MLDILWSLLLLACFTSQGSFSIGSGRVLDVVVVEAVVSEIAPALGTIVSSFTAMLGAIAALDALQAHQSAFVFSIANFSLIELEDVFLLLTFLSAASVLRLLLTRFAYQVAI